MSNYTKIFLFFKDYIIIYCINKKVVAHHLKVKIHFIFFSAAAGILIFRGELAIFLGLFLLMDLTVGRARLLPTLGYGFISLVIKKKIL